ncbi:ATP-binding protein [Planctomycetaceae bacterium SH139]
MWMAAAGAGALLDRLTHRVEILAIDGESYRLKQSQKAKR